MSRAFRPASSLSCTMFRSAGIAQKRPARCGSPPHPSCAVDSKQRLGHARAALQTRHGLAGSLLSNPAVRTWVCQRDRKAVCPSTSGKLPTTRSSLRLPSQLRSRHRNRSLGSQRQRSLGSQRQRRLGSRLGSHRSLCRSRRSHGLRVPSPEAFPRSPCRRRRTSPG